eukprot:1154551-Pelagomonas_calceolata.AAC.4
MHQHQWVRYWRLQGKASMSAAQSQSEPAARASSISVINRKNNMSAAQSQGRSSDCTSGCDIRVSRGKASMSATQAGRVGTRSGFRWET